MYKSCKYLEDGLYIAPNEIRACCQRFFYGGKMRGDAKLLDIVENKTPTTSDIEKARKKVFEDIQLNKNEDCKGCIFLEKTKKEIYYINKKIKKMMKNIPKHIMEKLRQVL